MLGNVEEETYAIDADLHRKKTRNRESQRNGKTALVYA